MAEFRVEDEFARHVMDAGKQILKEAESSDLRPELREQAGNIAEVLGMILQTPTFMTAVDAWMQTLTLVRDGATCSCSDDERHQLLRTCGLVMSAHTATWQTEVFTHMLKDLDLDDETITKVSEAFASKLFLSLTKVEETEAPDYVPAEWSDDERN